MASHIQIVLKHDVSNLGRSGKLVRVRPGYARNFLIPRGLAGMATRGNIEQVEHEQRLAFARVEKARAALQVEADKLEGVRVQIAKEAGDEGKLYGSVTAQDVAEALAAKGISVDKRKIQMPDEAIKQTGGYDLAIRIGLDVSAKFKLDVTSKA